MTVEMLCVDLLNAKIPACGTWQQQDRTLNHRDRNEDPSVVLVVSLQNGVGEKDNMHILVYTKGLRTKYTHFLLH